MKMLSRLAALGAVLTLVGAPVVASAADMATKAPPSVYAPATVYGGNWAGLYLDLYGLYAANTTGADVAETSGAATVDIANITTSPHGPGLGGAVGYNFQFAPGGLVLGPRVDFAWANIQGGGSALGEFSVSNATNWLGDIDFIVGLPLGPDGRLLAYTGGGFAFGGAKPNFQVPTVAQGISDTSTGWNVLAGLKYQLTQNWIVGIEGDYFQLGDKQLTIPLSAVDAVTSSNKYHIWEQKFILGYKF